MPAACRHVSSQTITSVQIQVRSQSAFST